MSDEWDSLGKAVGSNDDEWGSVGVAVAQRQRRLGERFVQNAGDALSRSALGQMSRRIDENANNRLDLEDVGSFRVRPDSPIDRVAKHFGVTLPQDAPTPAEIMERQRRETFQAESEADPWHAVGGPPLAKMAAGAATLAGQFGGAAASPENWVAPGKTILGRIVGNAGVGAGTDALLQAGDIEDKVQDNYSPTQTLAAGATAGALSGLADLGVIGARKTGEVIRPHVESARERVTSVIKDADWDSIGRAVTDAVKDNPYAPPQARSEAPVRVERAEAPKIASDDLWARLVTQESGGDQAAVSSKGAFGRAQLMPSTAKQVARDLGDITLAEKAKTDPVVNEMLGRAYLDQNLWDFGGDETLALAAYNAGPGTVRKWLRLYGDPREIGADQWLASIPYRETREYVSRISRGQIASSEVSSGARSADADHLANPEPARTGDGPARVEQQPGQAEVATALDESPLVTPSRDITDEALDLIRGGSKPKPEPAAAIDELRARQMDTADPVQPERDGHAQAQTPFEGIADASDGAALGGVDVRAPGEFSNHFTMAREPAADVLAARVDQPPSSRVVASDQIQAHADDLRQVFDHLGVDPSRLSNDQARTVLRDFYSARAGGEARPTTLRDDHPGSSGWDQLGTVVSREGPAVGQGVLKTEETPSLEAAAHDSQWGMSRPPATPSVGGDPISPKDMVANSSAELASRGTAIRAAPRPGAISRNGGAAVTIDSVSMMARRLKASMGITHRQGRMTMKGALGEYDPKSGVVRTKAVHELDVLAHEGGHALEFQNHKNLSKALKDHDADLRSMAYPGAAADQRREEGFAEWFRWYVTNPSEALSRAPKFYAAFESAMASDAPKMLDDLRAVQGSYQTLLKSASADVVGSAVVWPDRGGRAADLAKSVKERGVSETVREIADRAYTAVVDRLHPVKIATRELLQIAAKNTGQRIELKTAQDPYKLSRLAVGPYTGGQMDVLHGVRPYRGIDPDSPSLVDALSDALGKDWSQDSLKAFGDYLAARRMIAEWKRFKKGDLGRPPHGTIPLDAWVQTVVDYNTSHPEWKAAAEKVYDWTRALWKKQFESGLIGREAYESGLKLEDYVPLHRDVSDKRQGGAGVRGDAQFAGGVKAFRGSSRDVISPIYSLMERAQRVSALIERNEIFRALDDLAERAGRGAGAIVERVPASESATINVDLLDAFETAAKDRGYHEADYFDVVSSMSDMLGDDPTVPIFQAGVINPRGEPIVFLWKGGKREALRLPDGKFGRELFDVLTGMDQDQRSLVVDLLSKPTQLLRMGITLSPDFQVANALRDQLSAAIMTDVGFKPFFSFATGLQHELSKSDVARRYYTFGGTRGGANTAALVRQRVLDDVKSFRDLGSPIRVLKDWRALTELTEISERGTRLGLFHLAFEQAKKRGLSDYEAVKEASFTSRDVIDFDRYGSKMLAARRIMTFMNAGLQGLDKMRRVITAEGDLRAMAKPWSETLSGEQRRAAAHAYKALAMMTALGVLGAGLSFIYRDDPEYQEASDYLRATHWMFKAPGGQWISVPKPFELAVFSNIAERAVEAKIGGDPKATQRMAKGLLEIMVPPHEIPALAVPMQVAANRDNGGRPIIPDHLKGKVDPDLQFNSYTSETAKVIGRVLRVSPAVVDHVIAGISGTAGRYAVKASDDFVFARDKPKTASGLEDQYLVRRFVRDVTRQSTSQKEFWDLVSQSGGKLTKAEGSYRLLIKAGDDAKARAYLNKLDPAARDWALSQVMLKGAAKDAHPLARAKDAVSTISDLRRELMEGMIARADASPIELSPTQRRDADDALSYLAMTEMRNGLERIGVEGWRQKAAIPRESVMAKFDAIGPDLRPAIEAAYLRNRVMPETTAGMIWSRVAPTLRPTAESPALDTMMRGKRLSTRSGAYREAARGKATGNALEGLR